MLAAQRAQLLPGWAEALAAALGTRVSYKMYVLLRQWSGGTAGLHVVLHTGVEDRGLGFPTARPLGMSRSSLGRWAGKWMEGSSECSLVGVSVCWDWPHRSRGPGGNCSFHTSRAQAPFTPSPPYLGLGIMLPNFQVDHPCLEGR